MSFCVGRCGKKPEKGTKHNLEMVNNAFVMTAEQEADFIKCFPIMMNYDIMVRFGMSHATMHRFARKLGLKKDMKVIRKKQTALMIAICKAKGCYERLKGIAPSEACKEAYRKKLESGYHPMQVLKQNKKRYKELMARRSEHRHEQISEDRRRMRLGIDQKTNLHLPQFNYSSAQITCRYSAKKRGYILGDYRERFGERFTIYYDADTNRGEMFEYNLQLRGFTVKELKE